MPAQAGMAAKMKFSDKDVVDFLVNVEWVSQYAMLSKRTLPPCLAPHQ